MKWWQQPGAADDKAPIYDSYGRMTGRHWRWWKTKWWRMQRPFRLGRAARRRRSLRPRRPGTGLGTPGSSHNLQWQREQYVNQMLGAGGWVAKVPPSGDATDL